MIGDSKFVDANKARKERLFRVINPKKGKFIQFIVTDYEGKLLRQLGAVSQVEGQVNIGKKPPEGHGVKTNTPELSRALAGMKDDKKKEKKKA